jgi:hypothetical protein
MLRATILGLVSCVALAGICLAQEFPKPGPEHEKLAQLVGEWDATMEMAGQKSKCTATYKSICGGMWIASDFQGELGGMKFQGHGIDGYDLKKKKYVGTWVDSLESSPMTFEGDYDAKTKQLVLIGESAGPDGKPQKFKNVIDHKDKDHFTFKMYMVGADGKDTLAFTIEYVRKGAK